MRLVLKAAALLVVLGVIGLVGLAIFSDLPAPVSEITLPVEAR